MTFFGGTVNIHFFFVPRLFLWRSFIAHTEMMSPEAQENITLDIILDQLAMSSAKTKSNHSSL